jgi:hypothetical protein
MRARGERLFTCLFRLKSVFFTPLSSIIHHYTDKDFSMKNISLLVILALILTVGCIPKKKEAQPEAMTDPHAGMKMPGMEQTPAMPSAGALDYESMLAKLPEGWKRVETASSMRVAQVAIAPVKGDTAAAEMVFFHFPGTGGSAAANIQRWQGFYKGPKGEPGESIAKTDTMMVGLLSVVTTDVSGTQLASASMGMGAEVDLPNYRMIASVIETPSGNWFIKVTGPQKTMAANEAKIRAFLKTATVKGATS